MKIGDKVTVKAGAKIGMGILKKDSDGSIIGIEKTENNDIFYRILIQLKNKVKIVYLVEPHISCGKPELTYEQTARSFSMFVKQKKIRIKKCY